MLNYKIRIFEYTKFKILNLELDSDLNFNKIVLIPDSRFEIRDSKLEIQFEPHPNAKFDKNLIHK